MNECDYYRELISARLDGELTAAQEHELAEHLSRCADCRAVDAAFRALSAGIADCTEEPPADLSENVMAEIRRENIRAGYSKKKYGWRRLLATAACFAIIGAASAIAIPRLERSSEAMSGAAAYSTASDGAEQIAGEEAAPGENAEDAQPELQAKLADESDGVYLAGAANAANSQRYYSVSDEQLSELLLSLGGSAAEAPDNEPDETLIVESESDCAYVFIYGERVLYLADSTSELRESNVNSAGVEEFLAFFTD